jgi:hypothetical protein
VLHGVDAQDAVERVAVRKLLEPDALDRLGEPTGARLLDHAGRLVGPDDTTTAAGDELEVAPGPARDIQDDAARRSRLRRRGRRTADACR